MPTLSRRLHRTSLALLAGTIIGGAAGAGLAAETGAPSPDAVVAPKAGAIQPSAPANQLADFSDLVTQVKPAVVSITSHIRRDESEEGGRMTLPFPFGNMVPHNQNRSVEARGSGFLIDPDGTVVTNNHVVRDAEKVSVTLDDGTELPAKVVGTDPRTDLAVLKITAGRKLPFINLGESDQVKPGQWVLAVGNPFGLGGSVTAGIVSARGRDIGEGPYDSFIQVDAPINQGNSGGPLFTQDGKVVGVNTAILSPSGGSVGIGFAIPSDTVKTVVAQLLKSGRVTRGYLGVEAQPITPAMASALNLPTDHAASGGGDAGRGALVANIQPDSPAQRAGLQPGDVITQVDGNAIGTPRDLAVRIAAVQPGNTARIDVLHDGTARTLQIKLGDLPDQGADKNGNGGNDAHPGGIGVALAPLSPDLRDQLDLPPGTTGTVVTAVEPDSLAAQAGLRRGDVITAVGNKPVPGPAEAAAAIRAGTQSNHAVALRILRDGHSAYVAVGGAAPG